VSDNFPQPDSQLKEQARYANLFQIGYNAFEFLIEFGQQGGGVHTRIYLSPQHARIFSSLLVNALRQQREKFRGGSSELASDIES
jgi:hypothetical protein